MMPITTDESASYELDFLRTLRWVEKEGNACVEADSKAQYDVICDMLRERGATITPPSSPRHTVIVSTKDLTRLIPDWRVASGRISAEQARDYLHPHLQNVSVIPITASLADLQDSTHEMIPTDITENVTALSRTISAGRAADKCQVALVCIKGRPEEIASILHLLHKTEARVVGMTSHGLQQSILVPAEDMQKLGVSLPDETQAAKAWLASLSWVQAPLAEGDRVQARVRTAVDRAATKAHIEHLLIERILPPGNKERPSWAFPDGPGIPQVEMDRAALLQAVPAAQIEDHSVPRRQGGAAGPILFSGASQSPAWAQQPVVRPTQSPVHRAMWHVSRANSELAEGHCSPANWRSIKEALADRHITIESSNEKAYTLTVNKERLKQAFPDVIISNKRERQ